MPPRTLAALACRNAAASASSARRSLAAGSIPRETALKRAGDAWRSLQRGTLRRGGAPPGPHG